MLMDVADLDTTLAALQTATASDVMDHDGVLADTLVLLVETGRLGPGVTARQHVRSGYTPPVTRPETLGHDINARRTRRDPSGPRPPRAVLPGKWSPESRSGAVAGIRRRGHEGGPVAWVLA